MPVRHPIAFWAQEGTTDSIVFVEQHDDGRRLLLRRSAATANARRVVMKSVIAKTATTSVRNVMEARVTRVRVGVVVQKTPTDAMTATGTIVVAVLITQMCARVLYAQTVYVFRMLVMTARRSH